MHPVKRKILLSFISFVLGSPSAFAQIVEQPDPLRPSLPDSTKTIVQVDSSAADSTKSDTVVVIKKAEPGHVFRYRLAADGTVTSGNINRALVQLASAFDYRVSNNFKFSSNPSFVYGRQNGLLAEREWFGDFRATLFPERRFYYLGFGSFERSNLRQINRRWTVAGGVGYKFLDRKRAYISVTNVVLQEFSDFAELNDINVVRNSTRLYGEYQFGGDRYTITHTAFYQPALDRSNLRWNATLSLTIKLSPLISLRSTLANAYESLVVPGRQNNDLRFTAGLVYERK